MTRGSLHYLAFTYMLCIIKDSGIGPPCKRFAIPSPDVTQVSIQLLFFQSATIVVAVACGAHFNTATGIRVLRAAATRMAFQTLSLPS